MKNYLLILIPFMFLLSCENETETLDPSVFNFDFYEIEEGYEWIYEVDSLIIASGGNANITTSSQVREQIGDLISDDNGERRYELLRSTRKTENDTWVLTDVWLLTIDNNRIIRTEENLSFISLVFPLNENSSWDGNALFDSEMEFPIGFDNLVAYLGWNYEVVEIDIPHTIGETTYDETVRVVHIDDSNLLGRRFSEERYARGIGLIERNLELFDTQNTDITLEWVERAQSGLQLSQRLISYSR